MSKEQWSRENIANIYHTPLLELIFRASKIHQEWHRAGEVQLCTLLSVKTGGCPEDCAYCPQSSHYDTGVKAQKMLDTEVILKAAEDAKASGSSRFCMGVAWRKAREGKDFERLLEVIEKIHVMGMEVCCCLGMVTEEQALRLKKAGLFAYNHNLDTGPNFYNSIITTRTYQDRLDTLASIRKAKITTCCGGILGLGESVEDRIDLIHTLAQLEEPPESIPINTLTPIAGTPLANRPPVSVFELVRMIGTVRVVIPQAMIRLSAGRSDLSDAEQALCFIAGANSIHTGEKLLTTENCGAERDQRLIELLGIQPKVSQVTASATVA